MSGGGGVWDALAYFGECVKPGEANIAQRPPTQSALESVAVRACG